MLARPVSSSQRMMRLLGMSLQSRQARIAHPDRPLAPAHAGDKPFHPGIVDAIFGEARIENLEPPGRDSSRSLPSPKGLGRERGGGRDRRARAQQASSCHLAWRFPLDCTTRAVVLAAFYAGKHRERAAKSRFAKDRLTPQPCSRILAPGPFGRPP